MKGKTEKSEFYPAKEYYFVADSNYNVIFGGMIFYNLYICPDNKYVYGEAYSQVTITSDTDTINEADDVKLVILNNTGKILYESSEQKEGRYYKGDFRLIRVWNGIAEFQRTGSGTNYLYLDVAAIENGQNSILKPIGLGTTKLNSKFIDGLAVGRSDSKLCLVDNNFNDLTGCIFDEAYILKERHCIVRSNYKWAIIRVN